LIAQRVLVIAQAEVVVVVQEEAEVPVIAQVEVVVVVQEVEVVETVQEVEVVVIVQEVEVAVIAQEVVAQAWIVRAQVVQRLPQIKHQVSDIPNTLIPQRNPFRRRSCGAPPFHR
jgi:hypothetical protein